MKSENLDLHHVNRMLEKAHAVPHLHVKYQNFSRLQDIDDLQHLPPLTKNELAEAGPHLRTLLARCEQHALFFVSGGTMGSPKLSYLPPDMFITDITRYWRPLEQEDVLLNMFAPGKLWSAHYFYNALGAHLATVTIPLGTVDEEEFDAWLQLAQAQQVTALAATPTTIKALCRHSLASNRPLNWIKKLLWVGEAFDQELVELVRQVMPDTEKWGLYGSTETWVIGYNFPECPLHTFHLLPYQYGEIGPGHELLITNQHPQNLNILLRYQVGDAAMWSDCPCGRITPVLRVLERCDDIIKFRGTLVNVHDVLQLARALPEVATAQVAVITTPAGTERMELRVILATRDTPETRARIRNFVISQSLDTKNIFSFDPDGFLVVPVSQLAENTRTHKTALLLREKEACDPDNQA